MRRSYKFRMYPNKTQEALLGVWLDRCRELYNACLEIKRTWYKAIGRSPTQYDLDKQLPEVKRQCPEFKEVNAAVLQNVILKLDNAFKGFFRRCKTGETPGYPRFKSFSRFNSFTHPRVGYGTCKLTDKKVYLPNFGWIRWKPWKDLEDSAINPKTLTFKKEADGWYCVVSCEVEQLQPLNPTGRQIGIDLGLHNLVATSDGDFLGDIEPLKVAERKIRRIQSITDRRKRGSNRRKKTAVRVARASQHLERSRKTQLDVISRKIVRENDLIAIENLDLIQLTNLKSLTPTMTKGVHRNFRLAALGIFTHMISYKAEEAGRTVVRVNPRGTSQECSGCGKIVPKDLSVRVHKCPHCGLEIDRDTNAAKNVLNRALVKVPPAPTVPRGCEDQLIGPNP